MSRISRWCCIVALLVLHVVLYRAVLFENHLLLGSGTDLISAQIPYRAAASARLTSGQAPLWSPGHFAGAPLLASGQSGATYPLAWLLMPLSPERAVSLTLVLHLFLISLFTFLLALRLCRRESGPADSVEAPWACLGPLLAATLVALGGFMQSHIFAGHVGMIETLAWLPAVLLALDKLIDHPGPRGAALLAITGGLLLLAGHAQSALLAFIMILGWTASATPPSGGGRAHLGRALFWLVVAASGALLLGALLLVPAAEIGTLSHRRLIADPLAFAGSFSATPVALFQMVLAHPFGGGDPLPYWANFSRFETQGFVGAATLVLAATALAIAPRRRPIALLVLALAGTLLSLGLHTPLFAGLTKIFPPLLWFRAPGRFLLLPAITLPLLAGLGLHLLMHTLFTARLRFQGAIRPAVGAIVGLCGVMIIALPVASRYSGPEGADNARQTIEAHGGARAHNMLQQGRSDLAERAAHRLAESATGATHDALGTAGAILALALLARRAATRASTYLQTRKQRRRRKRDETTAPGGLTEATLNSLAGLSLGVLLILVPLARGVAMAGPFIITSEGSPQPAVSDKLIEAISARTGHDRVLWWEDRRFNVGLLHPTIRNLAGYDPAISWRLNDLLNLRHRRLPVTPRDEEVVDGAPDPFGWRHRLHMLWPHGRRVEPTPVWDLLGVRLVVSRAPRLGDSLPVETIAPYNLFVRDSALPRAGLAWGARVLPDEHQRLAALSWPSRDRRRELIFESPPEPRLPFHEGPLPRGEVRWHEDSPERQVLQVETEASAYLWIADEWRPGWSARVDGKPATLHRVDHALRGVALPPGEHEVELRYRPRAVIIAAALHLLGLALVVALMIFRRSSPGSLAAGG